MGKPCVLPSMGSQTVGYDWTTEQQQISPLSAALNTKISDVIHWESLSPKLSVIHLDPITQLFPGIQMSNLTLYDFFFFFFWR